VIKKPFFSLKQTPIPLSLRLHIARSYDFFLKTQFLFFKLDKKTENRQDFLRENIAPEHFAMTTQIDFDNQLPRCFARVLLKGETSIKQLFIDWKVYCAAAAP
jgi:hypothetical protein